MIEIKRNSWPAFLADAAAMRHEQQQQRLLRTIYSAQQVHINVGEKTFLSCCSNDYLGLAADTALKDTAIAAIKHYGVGTGASRLICGHTDIHQQLETTLAQWKGQEAALVFNSGYHANIGIISALTGKGDVIYSDALNHASLIDGCRLSAAQVRVYRHADLVHLRKLLAEDANNPAVNKQLIVTDSVFSMDADEAPLIELTELAEQYGAWLMIDEAHATGLLGQQGQGLAAALGLTNRIAIQMGTLGKSLGSFGAYVVGSRLLIDHLINHARSFIFTTALPTSMAAAANAAIDLIKQEPERCQNVLFKAQWLREQLANTGWHCLPGRVPILPIVVGSNEKALEIAEQLYAHGILASAIRPPTVPAGQARIRLTITAKHEQKDLEQIVATFVKLKKN